MIVNRRIFIAKIGCMEEATALGFDNTRQVLPASVTKRFYRSISGRFDQYGFEIEFENLAQYEQMVNEAFAKTPPQTWEKWHAVTEIGGTNELWAVTGGPVAPKPRTQPTLVNRRLFIAKKGCMAEAVALLKDVGESFGPPWSESRSYTDLIAPFDTFGYEVEFESLAQYEQAQRDVEARAPAEFWAKWLALIETGGMNEFWERVE